MALFIIFLKSNSPENVIWLLTESFGPGFGSVQGTDARYIVWGAKPGGGDRRRGGGLDEGGSREELCADGRSGAVGVRVREGRASSLRVRSLRDRVGHRRIDSGCSPTRREQEARCGQLRGLAGGAQPRGSSGASHRWSQGQSSNSSCNNFIIKMVISSLAAAVATSFASSNWELKILTDDSNF